MRRLRRGALALGGVLAAGFVWFLFFPVPVGWLVRHELAQVDPQIHVVVERAVFRWRWKQETCLLDVTGLSAEVQGRPLAKASELEAYFPKAGLRRKEALPSLAILRNPKLTLEPWADRWAPLRIPAVECHAEKRPAGAVWATLRLAGEMGNLPFTFAADVTVSSVGTVERGRAEAHAGPGRIDVGGGLPVASFDATVETDPATRRWRIPGARWVMTPGSEIALTGGAEVANDGSVGVTGTVRAMDIAGARILGVLAQTAPDLVRRLPTFISPGDVTIDALGVDLAGRVRPTEAGPWQPVNGQVQGTLGLRVKQAVLPVRFAAAMPKAGDAVTATVSVDRLRPAEWASVLPAAWNLAELDLLASLSSEIHYRMGEGPTRIGLRLTAGPGAIRPGGAALRLSRIALNAAYSPATAELVIPSLQVFDGVLEVGFSGGARLQPPYPAHGQLTVGPASLKHVFALAVSVGKGRWIEPWAQTLSGRLGRGELIWAGHWSPDASAPLTTDSLRGSIGLEGLRLNKGILPWPLAAGKVDLGIDYPSMKIRAEDIQGPACHLASFQAALDRIDPSARITGAASAIVDLSALAKLMPIPDSLICTGTAAARVTFGGSLAEDRAAVGFDIDLSHAKLGYTGVPGFLPTRLAAKVDARNWFSKIASPWAGFEVSAAPILHENLLARGVARFEAGDRRLEAIELTELEHGRTSLKGALLARSKGGYAVSLQGQWDAAPWMRMGLDWLGVVSAANPASDMAPAKSQGPPPFQADIALDKVVFGPDATATGLHLSGRADASGLEAAEFSAVALPDNRLWAKITRHGPAFEAHFDAANAPGWIRTLLAPWRASPPPANAFGMLVTQLAKVPVLVSGGALRVDATLRPNDGADRIDAKIGLSGAILTQAPRIVQLLALKSHRSLQRSPLIQEFAIDRLTLSDTGLRLSGVSLRGSGFLSKFALSQATYRMADEAVTAQGTFFGAGFEVVGTRGDPQVFLKEDSWLRVLGHPAEFDFDEPDGKPRALN